MHKELSVSLCAGDGRIDPAGDFTVLCSQRGGNFVAHPLMDRRISNHAAASIHFGLARLELRLDEQHELTLRSTRSNQVRQRTDDRDE